MGARLLARPDPQGLPQDTASRREEGVRARLSADLEVAGCRLAMAAPRSSNDELDQRMIDMRHLCIGKETAQIRSWGQLIEHQSRQPVLLPPPLKKGPSMVDLLGMLQLSRNYMPVFWRVAMALEIGYQRHRTALPSNQELGIESMVT